MINYTEGTIKFNLGSRILWLEMTILVDVFICDLIYLQMEIFCP